MDADLLEVEQILSQTADAPTFNVNPREIVLRAARRASAAKRKSSSVGSYQQTKSQSASQPDQTCSGETAEQLVSCLTVHEKPMVQYINRSSVPRIARQAVANRLTGQHLASLLQTAGLPASTEGLQDPSASDIRKVGVAAGLAQELSIYRKANSKPVYMNTAARTPADPAFLPAVDSAQDLEAAPAQGRHPSPGPSADAPHEQHEPAQEEEGGGEKRQRASAQEQSKGKPAEVAEPDAAAQASLAEQGTPAPVLQEADIGWDDYVLDDCGPINTPRDDCCMDGYDTEHASPVIDAWSHDREGMEAAAKARKERRAERVKQRQVQMAATRGSGHAQPTAASSVPASEPASGRSSTQTEHAEAAPAPSARNEEHKGDPASEGQEEYSPSNSLDARDIAFIEAGAELASPRQPASSSAAFAEAAGPPDEVRKATTMFVKAILDPLYQAKVVSRDVYKQVLAKAVDKILAAHAAAADPSFLVAEAGKIQRLVSGYIQHVQERLSA